MNYPAVYCRRGLLLPPRSSLTLSRELGSFQLREDENLQTGATLQSSGSCSRLQGSASPSLRFGSSPSAVRARGGSAPAPRVKSGPAPKLKGSLKDPLKDPASRSETLKRRKQPSNIDIFGTKDFRGANESRSETLSRKGYGESRECGEYRGYGESRGYGERVNVVNFEELIPRPKFRGKMEKTLLSIVDKIFKPFFIFSSCMYWDRSNKK